jgi:excinuclease ABC subunit A
LLLDHPAAGAHPADVEILVGVLDELVDKGASVLFAEHDQRVLEAADWMIKLGPGAGPHGGQILSSRARDHAVSRESGKSA